MFSTFRIVASRRLVQPTYRRNYSNVGGGKNPPGQAQKSGSKVGGDQDKKPQQQQQQQPQKGSNVGGGSQGNRGEEQKSQQTRGNQQNREEVGREQQKTVLIHDPKTFWRGKYYDLNPRQQEALKAYADGSMRVTNEMLKGDLYLETAATNENTAVIQAVAEYNEPIRVAITGASGQIGYALVFRIASGNLFGPRQPVILHLLELPQAMNALNGVVMELKDCAFPSLHSVATFDNAERAFEGVDWALLVGAQPRTKGMERADLLMKNAAIFSEQGKALNKFGKKKDTRVVVVGNPANTNAMIAQRNAPSIPPENFAAMTRLDHNRGLAQLALKAKCDVSDIDKFIIWGNHSATQFPDIDHATIRDKKATEVINDPDWVDKTFIPTVQQRGAEIIAARGSSSAASAANALIDNVFDMHIGTCGKWSSIAVYSKGEYGIEEGLFFSYPVVVNGDKSWSVVKDLSMSQSAQERINKTHNELKQERDGVSKLLPS